MSTSILKTTTRQRRAHRPPARESLAETGIAPAPYFRWKRGVDFLAAVVLLVPALPLIGLLVLLVRLTSRGPGIYAQVRVGRNGRLFTMYKIRSMRRDAEAVTGAVWAQARDPRVTLVGRILRKLHLDELPQLFNVLKGEMSLVGPRPERPEFVHELVEKIPGYAKRLAVAPGVTGLAQVNLPPDADFESVRRKLVLDLEYVRKANFLMDFRLAICTFARVVKALEPTLLRMFDVYREVPALGGDRKAACAPPASCQRPIPTFDPAHAFGWPPVPLAGETASEV
jgi:lipopolysaccharide/colanic/teichoic acid biosynthesis glycosyltransferase